MKCHFSCCGLWWCIVDLPARVLVRCTAKTFVLAFSLLILALAIPTIMAGVIALETDSFVARVVPSVAAEVLLATGGVMLATALAGFCAAACAVNRRRCSRVLLCLLMILTLIALVVCIVAAVSAFAYAEIVDLANQSGCARRPQSART